MKKQPDWGEIFEDKTSHRYIKPCFTPSYCQQIWFPCCLTAKWCSKHSEFPEASGRCGTSAVCAVALWLCSSDMFFFLWFNHLLTMPGIVALFIWSVFTLSFFLKRAREKLVVRWRCLLSIHFTLSQGQSFLVSSPAVWTHTLYLFLSLFLTVSQKWKYAIIAALIVKSS